MTISWNVHYLNKIFVKNDRLFLPLLLSKELIREQKIIGLNKLKPT